MQANRILLQRKYSRIIEMFAGIEHISLECALKFFYHSDLYKEISTEVSDMHCRSDQYLVEDLRNKWNEQV